MKESKLLLAGIGAFHRAEKKEFEQLMKCVSIPNYIPVQVNPTSRDIWFWGLKRWDREWSDMEWKIKLKNKNVTEKL